MAWVIVGVGTSVESTVAGNMTLVEPAGVADGDLLIACFAIRSTATTAISNTGWIQVGTQNINNAVAGTNLAVPSGTMLYQVRAGAPDLTFSNSSGISVVLGRIVAYRNVLATVPFDAWTAVTTATNVTAVSVTGLTTTAADDLIVALAASGRNAAWSAFNATSPAGASGATDTTTAPSSTWRERADVQTATGNDTSLAIFDAVKAAAGATGNLTATASLAAGQVVIAGAFRAPRASTADAWNVNDASTTTGIVTFSNVDKTVAVQSNSFIRSTQGNANETAGKFYAEFRLDVRSGSSVIALQLSSTALSGAVSVSVALSTGVVTISGTVATLGAFASGDVLCMAWDAGAERIWWRRNSDAWNADGAADPATGVNGLDLSAATAGNYLLRYRPVGSTEACTIRTELAEFTLAVPSGFASWMGEGGAPASINVTTGNQTALAVTQSSTTAVDLKVDAAQATAEAATAGTIQAQEAPRVVTGAQTTSATTQTSAVAAGLAVTGSQTLSPVTPTSAVKVGLAVTGAQNTNAATTLADAKAIATGTAAQTLAATTQTSGITLGPSSFAVTGAQTLSAPTQVLTASLSDPVLSLTGAQTTLAATSSAVAKALASATGTQNTNAVTQSLIADVDLAVTASQTLSLAATSATAKALAAVTGSQTLSAATTSAAAKALAAVTGSQTLSGASTTGAIVLTPFGTAVVNGAQTLSPVAQTSAIVLGPLPAAVVTGAQTTLACTTTGTISGEVIVEPPVELPSGGGGSRAYRRRLREAREGRRVFEDERRRRIAAIGREDERRDPLTMERAPLKPAPETIEMLNRLLYEPITREVEQPNPPAYEDDGGEEELLLLMLAA